MKKILVIEDTYEVRDNLDELLSLSGYEVHTAEDGRTGVKMATAVMPDLILCDIMMPDMDGFGVVRVLSRKPETRHIPFIFLTAKGEREDFRKGMNLGADDYLTKPFNDVELLDAIEMRLEKSQKTQEVSGFGEAFMQASKELSELENLHQNRETRRFAKKTELFGEGQRPRYLYYIHSGKVKVFRNNEWGKELITRIFRAGEFLGYEALFRDGIYTDSAAAMEEVEVGLIPKEDFLKGLHGSRELSAYFLKMLARNIQSKEEKLLQLAYDSIRKRVANALLELHECYGEEGISIMRDDLAALVGTAKETAIRTLSDFKENGYIRISKGEIRVLDVRGLASIPS